MNIYIYYRRAGSKDISSVPVSSLQSDDGGDNDMKFENSYDDDSTTNSHIIFGNSSIIDYRIASCFGYTCGMSIDNPGERYLGETHSNVYVHTT